jgi:hypothetical protein
MSVTSGRLLLCVWLAGLIGAMPVAAPGRAHGDESRPMRELRADGRTLRLDLSRQVLRIDIPEDHTFGFRQSTAESEAPISPTLHRFQWDTFVSASMLAQKAKQFDDGLYAAVELAAQSGAGDFAGKAQLLQALTRSLMSGALEKPDGALQVVFAASELGGVQVDVPERWRGPVQSRRDAFLSNDLLSKPIGFYTWSESLRAIFRQDRMLQGELEGRAGTEAIVRALHGDATARSTYEGYLALVSRLTNPLAAADLRPRLAALDSRAAPVSRRGACFFPPSRAHETDLCLKLYGNAVIPEGFNLVDEMIGHIREGDLDLTPRPESGWYDYQTWALEPLVVPERMPEASHLQLGETYRKQLLELFKGILALTRETHVKQLEIALATDAAISFDHRPVEIHPELAAEPLATYYLRRAQSYRFVRGVLEACFGHAALGRMHRLTAEGHIEPDLDAELAEMEALFGGAYVTVRRQLGMAPDTTLAASVDTARFEAWTRDLAQDPDLGRDARMMVPVFYDPLRHKTKVWVFLGWVTRPVSVSFATRPSVRIFDATGAELAGEPPGISFGVSQYSLAYPVTAEIYVEKILDRDEFRRHCDRYQTRTAILAKLE